MSISGDSHKSSPQTYEPVMPTDLTRGSYHSAMGPPPQHTINETRSSSESSGASLKSPRTARFAEATTIHSPIEPAVRSPFADPQKNNSDGGVGDVGFGYVSANDPAQHADDSLPPVSPWRADMKVPNTARSLNPLSPTFREEYMLEKQEKTAEKENARDLVRNTLLPIYLFIFIHLTYNPSENQTSSPNCQDLPPFRQLWLQSDCLVSTGSDSDRLQGNTGPPDTKWSSSMGRGYQPMGSIYAFGNGCHLALCLLDRFLGLLERRA